MTSEIVQKTRDAVAQLTGAGAPWEIGVEAIDGIDYLTYLKAPRNLQELFAPARAHGDKEAVVYEGERWTFNQLLQQADSISRQLLQRQGLRKGDRVAIAMRNYPEWLSAFIGITSAGLVAVPLNSWGRREELEYGLRDSGSRVVFCDQQRLDHIAPNLAELDTFAVLVRGEAEPAGDRACSLATFLQGAEHAQPPTEVALQPEDDAMIVYTSGTTGNPKGAVSTHFALGQAIYNFECTAIAAAMADPGPVGKMLEAGFEQTAMLVVPLFHVSGLHSVFLLSLRAGRRVVMMYKWDVARALQLIEQERVTMMTAVPTMTMEMLSSPLWEQTDTASLFGIGGGGTASPPTLAEQIRRLKPDSFPGTGWGLTESNAVGASFTGAAYLDNPRAAGLPHPIVALKFLDEDGHTAAAGQPGQIWIKVASHFKEYWGRPDATAETLRDGWVDSGDIGYLDDDGFLYISDRAKDMVIRGGENIYCAEIENVAHGLPAVVDAAAFGVPHPTLGEELVLTLRVRPDSALDAAAVKAHFGAHLAAFKVPAHVALQTEELPKNASGKTLKRVLKQAFLDQRGGG